MRKLITMGSVGALLLAIGALATAAIWTAVTTRPIANTRWSMGYESTGTQTITFTPGRACELKEIRMTGNVTGTFTGTSVTLNSAAPTGAWFDPTLTVLDSTNTRTRWITYDPGPTLNYQDSIVVGLSASATTVGVVLVFERVP